MLWFGFVAILVDFSFVLVFEVVVTSATASRHSLLSGVDVPFLLALKHVSIHFKHMKLFYQLI